MSARVIRFTCERHGEIWSASVWCQHDTEAEVRAVADGHHKPYGANCRGVINVELLDPETMLPDAPGTRRLHPPQDSPS